MLYRWLRVWESNPGARDSKSRCDTNNAPRNEMAGEVGIEPTWPDSESSELANILHSPMALWTGIEPASLAAPI